MPFALARLAARLLCALMPRLHRLHRLRACVRACVRACRMLRVVWCLLHVVGQMLQRTMHTTCSHAAWRTLRARCMLSAAIACCALPAARSTPHCVCLPA
jgi:hypothetical protein